MRPLLFYASALGLLMSASPGLRDFRVRMQYPNRLSLKRWRSRLEMPDFVDCEESKSSGTHFQQSRNVYRGPKCFLPTLQSPVAIKATIFDGTTNPVPKPRPNMAVWTQPPSKKRGWRRGGRAATAEPIAVPDRSPTGTTQTRMLEICSGYLQNDLRQARSTSWGRPGSSGTMSLLRGQVITASPARQQNQTIDIVLIFSNSLRHFQSLCTPFCPCLEQRRVSMSLM
ncbi:hypothetical protein IWX92DRAFT_389342 [Phyllosticta citricarpa]